MLVLTFLLPPLVTQTATQQQRQNKYVCTVVCQIFHFISEKGKKCEMTGKRKKKKKGKPGKTSSYNLSSKWH